MKAIMFSLLALTVLAGAAIPAIAAVSDCKVTRWTDGAHGGGPVFVCPGQAR
jgi:hypothetical protein